MAFAVEAYESKSKSKEKKWGPLVLCAAKQKRHFLPSDYDLLEKERLVARTFGHIRHNYYKSAIQPSPRSLSYISDKDRFNESTYDLLKADHHRSQAKKKAILELHTTNKASRDRIAINEREDEWMRQVEHDVWMQKEHPHARVVANRSSVPYDLITLQYHHGFEGEKAKYREESARWRANVRAWRIYTKSNGDRNYDVISWDKKPLQLTYPKKPEPKVFSSRDSSNQGGGSFEIPINVTL